MGGERSEPSSRMNSLEGQFLCEIGTEPAVVAEYCMSETIDGSGAPTSKAVNTKQDQTNEVCSRRIGKGNDRVTTQCGFDSDTASTASSQEEDLIPNTKIGEEVSKEIQGLFISEGTRSEGMMQKRIQVQNELLCESIQSLGDMRDKIKSYRPGDGIFELGGISRVGFAIPKVTTLLLVGPSCTGKSTLVNNMIRVLGNLTTGFDRAQTYGEMGNGSLFLQEYFLYKDTKHFCVFDSRGFSDNNVGEDLDVMKKWMTDGICHGEAVCRPSDSKMVREAIEGRGRQGHSNWSVKRRVDFVVFVVNAVSVRNMKESHDLHAIENLAMRYKSPFLSFKDDRPVVVMSHGDKLSQKDRILTRIFIGELFGVSPVDQVFDISCFTERSVHPGYVDLVNDLVLLNMLDFALERADRNLPYKSSAALRLHRAWGAVIDSWNMLDIGQRIPLIIIIFWLFSMILVLTAKCAVHGWKLSPLLRNFGGKQSPKWHKKIRDFGGQHRF